MPDLELLETSNTQPHSNRADVNRANSQHSTGPRTEAGKQRSSMNALTHGLTARAALLPSEDPAAHQRHIQGFFDEYQPKGASEMQLVQTLADTAWRLNRVATLEDELLSRESDSLETQIRSLNSLGMHGYRLSRQFASTLKQLREIQKERRAGEQHQLAIAADLLQMDQDKGIPYNPAADGFVFSREEIDTYIRRRKRAQAASDAASYREEDEEEEEEDENDAGN